MSLKQISQSRVSGESKSRPNHITASGMEQAALCPGSFAAQKGKPNSSNALADAGTRIHDALEAGNIDNLDDEDEQQLAVRAAQLRDEVIDGFFLSQPMFDEVMKLEHEKQFHLREQRLFGLAGTVSGRFDGLVVDEHRALIFDYKTGYAEPIDAQHNLQMRCYAVLVAENYEHVTEVTAAIIQPRIRPEISLVEYKSEDLDAAAVEIQSIIDAANAPNAPRQAGPLQCKYCRAKADCGEATQLTVNLNKLQGATIPDEKLPELLTTCSAAKKIIEAIELRARDLLDKDPEAIPGYKLKPGAKKAEIINPQKLFNRCNERHSILPHEFVDVCDIGKGRLKALIKQVTALKGKGLDDEMDSLLHGLVKYTPNRSSLARDKRTAAIMPKFKGIEDV
jgi:CRISPR/Cas system-associated exonuclease Cas4 (RecB family)